MPYLPRVIDLELDDLFPELPAIALDGAKGVGKTATASARAASITRLDIAAPRDVVLADPQSILTRPRPLLIDEWQHVPAVWDVVRRAVDEDRTGGQFLLTGSATPKDGATAHSGAGRIVRLRMRPMTLTERDHTPQATVSPSDLLTGRQTPIGGETSSSLVDYTEAIVSSGLPGLRGLSPRALRSQLDSYLYNIVDRDIPEQGVQVRRPDVMTDWLRAYAAATSTTASYTAILDAATARIVNKPDRGTTATYRDALTQIWVLDGIRISAKPTPADPQTPPVRSCPRCAPAGPHHRLAPRWSRPPPRPQAGNDARSPLRVTGDAVRACRRPSVRRGSAPPTHQER